MSDLISREEVLDLWHLRLSDEEIYKAIYELPSADVKGDLISRQAVLDELEKWEWQDLYLPIHFKQILDDIPSVDNKGECKECKWFDNERIYNPECENCSHNFNDNFCRYENTRPKHLELPKGGAE